MRKTLFIVFIFFWKISFSQTSNIGGVINTYTPVSAFNPCTNKITVQSAASFKVGDTVLLIQMKGALIDTTNTANFGNVVDYKGSGNYEFNYIKSIAGSIIEFQYALTRNYDLPNGRVQLVRVPYYNNVLVTAALTCLPWDGTKGGVLVFNVKNNIQLQQDIDVSGKGFHGGIISNNPDGNCGTGSPDYYYPLTQPANPYQWNSGGAEKGEGIAEVSASRRAGKGKLGNGGGGGNKHNYGGGGGSNYGNGGLGGNGLDGCGTGNMGIGGVNLNGAYANNKIFFGGGGGRGDDNNGVGTVGVNGGGIVIISANSLDGGNHLINANGLSQLQNGGDAADGAGGGGGGGVILLNVQNFPSPLTLQASGGKGGSQAATWGCVGPGGGGSGGYIGSTGASFPSNIVTSLTGGKAGLFVIFGYSCYNTSFGATNGQDGAKAYNISIPTDNTPFKRNIDSIRIAYTPTSCADYNFQGLSYTTISPVQTWQWYFDGIANATTQTISNHFGTSGVHAIKLVGTDANSCTDSFSISINTAASFSLSAGKDSAVCKNTSFTLHGNGTGVVKYLWAPAGYFKDNTLQNPVGTVSQTTKLYLTATNTLGCTEKDSVNINVYSAAAIKKTADTSVCTNTSLQLSIVGATGGYLWSPVATVSNPGISNPVVSPIQNTTYYVTFLDANACNNNDSIKIYIRTQPQFTVSPDQSTCGNTAPLQLNASGGDSYTWSPASLVSNAAISNPLAIATTTTTYTLTIKEKTCNTSASLNTTVKVSPAINITIAKSNDLDCSNGSAQLIVTGGNSYSWYPSSGLSNTTISNPTASPLSTQQYFVKATDVNGCSALDSITIFTNFVNNSLGYYMPNAFTPNGDGRNDCFGTKNWGDIEKLVFIIYNRWGNEVFSATTTSACWDGTFNGQPANTGTYLYYIKAVTPCGIIEKKGDVVLIR